MKKVAVIGGGIAGLSAAVYALQNGYDVTVFEKLPNVGGMCVSWERQNCIVDGCLHWLTGSNPSSPFYKHWANVGALSNEVEVIDADYFCRFVVDGKTVTIWSDADKLNAELISIAPEDAEEIDFLVAAIKAYKVFDTVPELPDHLMTPQDKFKQNFAMRSVIKYLKVFIGLPVQEYALRFKNAVLRTVMKRIMPANYAVHYLAMTLSNYSRKNAGVPVGGSMAMTRRMEARAVSLGAIIRYNSPVSEIVTANGKAVGVMVGDEYFACDAVISCIDINYMQNNLLKDYMGSKPPAVSDEDYPVPTCLLISYASQLVGDIPEVLNFSTENLDIGSRQLDNIYYRYFNYDKTIVGKHPVLQVMVYLDGKDADYWDELKQSSYGAYKAEKQRIGEEIKSRILAHFNQDSGLTLLDVATPETFKRYVNTYKGSYMSYVPTGRAEVLPQTILIAGVKGLYNGGQWAEMYGGTPKALLGGKNAVQSLCFDDGKPFIMGGLNGDTEENLEQFENIQ